MAALIFGRAGLVRVFRPVSTFYAAGHLVPAFINSVAIAGSCMAVLAFAGAFGAVDTHWQGVGIVLLAMAFGLVLAGLVLAPYLRAYGGYTLPDFLAERFGSETMRSLGILGVLLCSAPALVVVMFAFGVLGEAVFALPSPVGIAGGAVLIFVATLIGGMRSLSLSQFAYAVVMLLAGFVAMLTVLWETGSIMGTETIWLNERIPELGWRAFAPNSFINSFALLFCLTTGFASLPFILMRSFTAPTPKDARLSFLGAPVLILLLCLAAPAFAALYEAASIASGDVLSMISQAVLVVGSVAALLSCGAALALSIANVLSYDLYFKALRPLASVSERILAARLAVILVTVFAGLGAWAAPGAGLTGATAAFSLAATGFLPSLVLGLWWRKLSGEAATAGVIAGLVVCLYYLIAPETIPYFFYESSRFLSDATIAQAAAYEALRHDYYVASDLVSKSEILTQWRAAADPIANWFGVDSALAGVFAVPIGFLVTVLAGLFTAAPSSEAPHFADVLRARPEAPVDDVG